LFLSLFFAIASSEAGKKISRRKARIGPAFRRGQIQKGEATQSIVLTHAIIFFSAFSAQKSHVKSQNHLNHYHPTTSAWHFS
jgi:hypothetical protein